MSLPYLLLYTPNIQGVLKNYTVAINVVYRGKIIFLQIFVLAVVYYFDRVGIKINDYTKNIGNLNRYFQDKTLLIKTTKSVMSRSHFESKGLIPFAPYLVSISKNSF